MGNMKWTALGLLGAAGLSVMHINAAIGQEALKIGVPTALTGTYAGLGNEAVRAVELAAEEANAKGGVAGRNVEIKVLDTEAKPEVARKQAEKLASEGYRIFDRDDRLRRGLGNGSFARALGRALRLDNQQERQTDRQFLRAAGFPRE